MAIPKYNETMLPLLRFLWNGRAHKCVELANHIGDLTKDNVEIIDFDGDYFEKGKGKCGNIY